MGADRILTARGLSMLPSILPGSKLAIRAVDGDHVRPGDVLCYPTDRVSVTAHRVVDIERDAAGKVFVTRGDAQGGGERVPESAAAFRVTRVCYGPLSYRTDGSIGRITARMALRGAPLWRAGGHVLGMGLRFLRMLRRARFERSS